MSFRGRSPSGHLAPKRPPAGQKAALDSPTSRLATACSTPAQTQEGGRALGKQVPDTVWRYLLTDAGFTRFRRAPSQPFSRVFEVRR